MRETGRKIRRGWGRLLFGLAVGASLGQLQLPPGFFPFGPAFYGAWLKNGLGGGFLVFFITFFALYSHTGLPGEEFPGRILLYLPVLLGIYCARRQKQPWANLFAFLLPAAVHLTLWFTAARHRLAFFLDPRKALGEVFLLYLLVYALTPGTGFLFSPLPKPGKNNREVLLSLSTLAVLVFFSLGQAVDLGSRLGIPLAADLFFAFFLIFLTARRYGTGGGTIAAVVFGGVEALCGQTIPLRFFFITGSGIAAGLGYDLLKKKYGFVLGFLVHMVLAAARWWDALGLEELLLTGTAAAAVFLACPDRFCRRIEDFLPLPAGTAGNSRQQKRLKEVVVERLQSLARLFEQIAGAFTREEGEKEDEGQQEIYEFIEKISEQRCRFCPCYSSCWGQLFYSTYREIFDLIAAAEISGMADPAQIKGRLAKECPQKQELIIAVNSWVERQQAEHLWRRRYQAGQAFLAGQLREMSGIIAGLTHHLKLSVEFRAEIEEELRAAFQRMNLPVKEMIVTGLEKNRVEIFLEKKACRGQEECRRIIAPLISQLLGRRFTVHRQHCPAGADGECGFYLLPRRCYRIESAVEKIPRDGNTLSGDSHSILESKEGYTFAILSDGMGAGPGAARQSSTTVSLLQNLLITGLEKDFCLQLLNSLLLLRSPEESFATLDLFVFDQFTAETELIKIGAAPTYIKRGKEVNVISSTSLPVGILNNVEPEYIRCVLRENDIVVMVTDGVTDPARVHNRQKEDWICKILTQLDLSGVDNLCRYLLEAAKIEAGGNVEDDMTILALQVLRENPRARGRI
ncbi:MAG: SpoIIE family protein phosphatase [Firmicutes bacterium]|nr:SpoIIE family protein phosphatase [Bacillota bacterium]